MLRKFFSSFDMFGGAPTFRMRGESEALNTCGGCFSFLLLCGFFSVFVFQVHQIVTYQEIEAKSSLGQQRRNQTLNVPLFFAIGVVNVSFESFNETFTLEVYNLELSNGAYSSIVPVPMERCTLDHLLYHFQEKRSTYMFQQFSFQDKFCTPNGFTVEMVSAPNLSSQRFKYLGALIQPCYLLGGVDCLGISAFDAKILQLSNILTYGIVQFYLMATGFKPQEEDPTITYFDGDNWLGFSKGIGANLLAQLGTYEIVTDVGMTPFITEETLTGYYVADKAQNNFQREHNAIVQVAIALSNKHYFIERQYGKLDDALSYIGGLFGFVIAFFAFFLMSFNEYRYELFVSEAFAFKDQEKAKEENFHFFKYLKYVLYDWLKNMCCCELDWEDCKQIEMARDEANEHIDVKFLLRRFSHLERLCKEKTTSNEDLCILITEDQTVEDVRKKRKVMSYYDKVTHGQSQLTMESMNQSNRTAKYGMGLDILESSISKIFTKSRQSEEKLELALKRAEDFIEFEDIELEEEEREVEEELSEAFYDLSPVRREAIQERISLRILKRLKDVHEANGQKARVKPHTMNTFTQLIDQ